MGFTAATPLPLPNETETNQYIGSGEDEARAEETASTSIGTDTKRGKGGAHHKHLQQRIATACADAGVAIYAPGCRIACEISVSTSVTHEMGNIEKYLEAGFDNKWVISEDARLEDALDKIDFVNLD